MKTTQAILAAVILVALFTPSTGATHDPNDFFALETAFPGYVWNDIHGTSSTNLFAVGGNGGVSAIAYRGTGSWVLQTVPNIGVLRGVWVQSATFAVAIGTSTSFVEWDGATWTTVVTSAPFGLLSVWGLDADDVVLVSSGATTGAGMTILHYDGTSIDSTGVCVAGFTLGSVPIKHALFWTTVPQFFPGLQAQASTEFELNAASNYDCDPTSAVPTGVQVLDVWASSLGNVWAVGPNGAIYRKFGVIYNPLTSSTTDTINGIWGLSSTNIWAVGDTGTIIHTSDGNTFTAEPSLATSETLNGVYFSDAANGWIVSQTGNIYKLQVNPNNALPGIGIAEVHEESTFDITVSQAQCLGDDTSFSLDLELGSVLITVSDLDVYIINSKTGVLVEAIDDSAMFGIGSRVFYFAKTYPSGDYMALAKVDLAGLGSADYFDSAAFNVPAGSCFTAGDAQQIQNRFDALDASVAWINATTTRTEGNLTQVNLTVQDAHEHIDSHFVYQNLQLNQTHAHIDLHFVYTNMLLNDTFAGAVFNVTVGSGIANETVTLLANEFGLALGETTTLNILIILLMVVIGVWLYRNKKHDIVLRVTGILIVLTAGVIALSVATAWTGGAIFAALVCFFAGGLMVVGALDYQRERKGTKEKGEMDL